MCTCKQHGAVIDAVEPSWTALCRGIGACGILQSHRGANLQSTGPTQIDQAARRLLYLAIAEPYKQQVRVQITLLQESEWSAGTKARRVLSSSSRMSPASSDVVPSFINSRRACFDVSLRSNQLATNTLLPVSISMGGAGVGSRTCPHICA